MELRATALAERHYPGARQSAEAAAIALGLLPVVYLGFSGGGYDSVVFQQVGVIAWWLLAAAAVTGVLRSGLPPRAAWPLLGALSGLVLWTAFGLANTESVERTWVALSRMTMLLACLALPALALRRSSARLLVLAVGGGGAVLVGMAVLSRLAPGWFPHDQIRDFFPGTARRLAYPLNSPNALGCLAAMSVPLLLSGAITARRVAVQAAAAAAVPVVVLGLYLTQSRGGVLALATALVFLLLLSRRRILLLATLTVVAAGSLILCRAAAQRDAVSQGVEGALARAQAKELFAFIVVTCLGVALLQAATGLAARHAVTPTWPGGRRARVLAVVAAAVVGAAAVATQASEIRREATAQWNVFTQLDGQRAEVPADVVGRLADVSGSHRYQYWQSALDAYETEPVRGIGAGSFELWWARDRPIPEFVRDAHSLYIQTLAEAGIVGLALLLVLILGALLLGAVRAFDRRSGDAHRGVAAGATAAIAAFAAAAVFDWVWQVTVLPMIVMLLTGALIASGARPGAASDRKRPRLFAWVAIVAASAIAIVVLAIPLAQTTALRSSRALASAGDLSGAMEKALSASRLEPGAASPIAQQALISEQSGDLRGARRAIVRARAAEPTNWRWWLISSRLSVKLDRPAVAISELRRARQLNPQSRMFK